MNQCTLKVCILVLALSSHLVCGIRTNVQQNKFIHSIRFRSVKCRSDNTTIFVKYCYLKAVSRDIVTLNLGTRYLVPYTKPFYVRSVFSYRYGTIFREIINTQCEACALVEGAEKNPLIKALHGMLRSRAPKLVTNCPAIGDWDLKNFTMDLNLVTSASMIFPEGIYKIDVTSFYNGSASYNFSGTAEIKSPLKESFG